MHGILWGEPGARVGLGNIAILSPLHNIRVYMQYQYRKDFHISIISHMQYIAQYRQILQD